MSRYIFDNFLCNSYSDEITPIDQDEINRLMVEDDDGWPAYAEWANQLEATERSAALDQYAFERKQERLGSVNVSGVPIFINRDCDHSNCKFSRCSREVRLMGVAI